MELMLSLIVFFGDLRSRELIVWSPGNVGRTVGENIAIQTIHLCYKVLFSLAKQSKIKQVKINMKSNIQHKKNKSNQSEDDGIEIELKDNYSNQGFNIKMLNLNKMRTGTDTSISWCFCLISI